MKNIAGMKVPERWGDVTTAHYVERLADLEVSYVTDERGTRLRDEDDYFRLITALGRVDEVPDMTVDEVREFVRATAFVHQEIPDLTGKLSLGRKWYGRRVRPELRDMGDLPFDQFMVLDKYLTAGGNPLRMLPQIVAVYTKADPERVMEMPITHTYALFFSLLRSTGDYLRGIRSSLEARRTGEEMGRRLRTAGSALRSRT